MALPTLEQQTATTAIAAEGAVMATELNQIDDTLVSIFVVLDDMKQVSDRIAAAVEGMFEIQADRWSQEELGQGLALEAQRESTQAKDSDSSEFNLKGLKEIPKNALSDLGGLALALAAAAGAAVAFSDDLKPIIDSLKPISDTLGDVADTLGIDLTTGAAIAGGAYLGTKISKALGGKGMKGGIRGALATYTFLIAEDISKWITDQTGSEGIGDISEYTVNGIAAGVLLGGIKGGIAGALIGLAVGLGEQVIDWMKGLRDEQTNIFDDSLKEFNDIVTTAKNENRDLTEDEVTRIKTIKAEAERRTRLGLSAEEIEKAEVAVEQTTAALENRPVDVTQIPTDTVDQTLGFGLVERAMGSSGNDEDADNAIKALAMDPKIGRHPEIIDGAVSDPDNLIENLIEYGKVAIDADKESSPSEKMGMYNVWEDRVYNYVDGLQTKPAPEAAPKAPTMRTVTDPAEKMRIHKEMQADEYDALYGPDGMFPNKPKVEIPAPQSPVIPTPKVNPKDVTPIIRDVSPSTSMNLNPAGNSVRTGAIAKASMQSSMGGANVVVNQGDTNNNITQMNNTRMGAGGMGGSNSATSRRLNMPNPYGNVDWVHA